MSYDQIIFCLPISSSLEKCVMSLIVLKEVLYGEYNDTFLFNFFGGIPHGFYFKYSFCDLVSISIGQGNNLKNTKPPYHPIFIG